MTMQLTSTTIAAVSPERATFSIRRGEKQTGYTNTFPARRYWYRHDKVLANGVELEGFLQTKGRQYNRYGERIETITCFRQACVMGAQLDWLFTMNREGNSAAIAVRNAMDEPGFYSVNAALKGIHK